MACPLYKLLLFTALLILQLIATCKATLAANYDEQLDNAIRQVSSVGWEVTYDPPKLNMDMSTTRNVTLRIERIAKADLEDIRSVQLRSEREHVAWVENGTIVIEPLVAAIAYNGSFTVVANFLGQTSFFVELVRMNGTTESIKSSTLPITVIRPERVIDHVFTGSVILLISILYINFGAALDVGALKQIARRPIGPMIGFVCQFVFMPLLSYGLGHLLFPDNYELQLGLFFTGVSPAGGASNIWTVALGGNLTLSIAMTTISTIAAFGMMPLWIFTLGRTIFQRANLVVPYSRIAYTAVGLVVPISAGLLIQRYCPRFSRLLVRILKPMSVILILFIVIFAIVTNLYLFELFSWQIIIAGLGLPLLGYCFGFLASTLMRLPLADSLAISVETGIQNTGIAIFLLRFALEQPAADLTTVMPVSNAIMTPLPLLLLLVGLRIHERTKRRAENSLIPKTETDPVVATPE
ncbi:P3 protein isoform X1 [Anopheles gambiae]|uniref:Sodium-bile acid cotransporter n=1 Tax=Anopheles coluzzii TaxID=1518534 RepID=A0A6E8VC53_ANOCL|nr:P3 protein isoform X1 [Anopheles coluzzii]XP_040219586.2 P3 protein isoform X1 [Anopheles coluzzii]XP_061507390.1 P3 protein isoform X1 [Anopheles gambiae]XP_061507391.1 P3 protein isoform X1 [Anopheles gambiae]XP_563485.5 P3 protein isoform X1 [Anopheles gambiae]